jgi:hypothetical protein
VPGRPGRVCVEAAGVSRNSVLGSRPPGSEERVLVDAVPAVRFRLEGGARQLGALSSEEKAHVLERAARRAFPGAWTGGAPPRTATSLHGQAAVVRVYLPPRAGGSWPDLLPQPEAHARFVNEFYRAGAEMRGLPRNGGLLVLPGKLPARGRPELVSALAPATPGGAGRVRLSHLSAAVPAVFRLARGLSRLVGSLLPARED